MLTMRYCGIDLETTGLDLKKDRILKLGLVIFEPDSLPDVLCEIEFTLWDDSYPEIKPEAFLAHRLKKQHVIEFGRNPRDVFFEMAELFNRHNVQVLVAHNGHAFDFPLLQWNIDSFYGELNSHINKMTKIDTMMDLPVPGKKLSYLAADHGFLNPWPHSALSDIRTMIKVLEHYPMEKVLDRANSKPIRLIAKTTYDEREKPKRAGFNWDGESKVWHKNLKECDLKDLALDFQYEIRN